MRGSRAGRTTLTPALSRQREREKEPATKLAAPAKRARPDIHVKAFTMVEIAPGTVLSRLARARDALKCSRRNFTRAPRGVIAPTCGPLTVPPPDG